MKIHTYMMMNKQVNVSHLFKIDPAYSYKVLLVIHICITPT